MKLKNDLAVISRILTLAQYKHWIFEGADSWTLKYIHRSEIIIYEFDKEQNFTNLF